MPAYTRNINLLKPFVEDYADVRAENINWDLIDALFHPHTGHDHDGFNAPLIDPVNFADLWAAIEAIRRLLAKLREDLNIIDLRERLHYDEYSRHRHFALEAPPAQETAWFETFIDYLQTNANLSDGVITPPKGILHLPADHGANEPYWWVGRPFDLTPDPTPVGVLYSGARASIIRKRRGEVTPYIVMGENLSPSMEEGPFYPGARAGEFVNEELLQTKDMLKWSYAGKRAGGVEVPHEAFHYLGIQEENFTFEYWYDWIKHRRRKAGHRSRVKTVLDEKLDVTSETQLVTPPNPVIDPSSAEWAYNIPFTQQDYDTVATSDGRTTVTGPASLSPSPVYEEVDPVTEDYRPLYQGEVVLSWDRTTNRFAWFNSLSSEFTPIPNTDLGPIYDTDLLEVAATEDRNTGMIYVLKTKALRVDSPAGHFDMQHQVIRWDLNLDTQPIFTVDEASEDAELGAPTPELEEERRKLGGRRKKTHHKKRNRDTSPERDQNQDQRARERDRIGEPVTAFTLGPWFKSGRSKRFNWLPRVLAPTHLHLTGNKLHVICSFDWGRADMEGEPYVNYYESLLDFMWFPFGQVYGDLHRRRRNVRFALFNPGVLGTVHTINLTNNNAEWVVRGTARVIPGAYSVTSNGWAGLTDEQVEAFDGANDKVYMGGQGNTLWFYQSFVPYDGHKILNQKLYEDPAWLQANPETSWHGFVGFDLDTGNVRYEQGSIPNRVNVGGGLYEETAVLADGQELVRQFVLSDNRVIATADNLPPTQPPSPIKYTFWIDRFAPGAKVHQNFTVEEFATSADSYHVSSRDARRWRGIPGKNQVLQRGKRSRRPHIIVNPIGHGRCGGWEMEVDTEFSVRVRQGAMVKTTLKKKSVHAIFRRTVRSTAYAQQVFLFDTDQTFEPGDVVYVYYKGKGEGRLAAADNDAVGDWDVAIDLHVPSLQTLEPEGEQATEPGVSLVARNSGWVNLGYSRADLGTHVFAVPYSPYLEKLLDEEGALVLRARSRYRTDPQTEAPSRLKTDFIYMTMNREVYRYDYEWQNMPHGEEAAVVLRLAADEDAAVDPLGLEVQSVEASIITSE